MAGGILMKFEKISENKIRITLNIEDLKEKDIDFHSFMSNSIESQDLFLDMLDQAEKEVGFVTKDYRVMIEALAMSNGNFVLTITRMIPDVAEKPKRKKVAIKRKHSQITEGLAIYRFETFDDFCMFCQSLKFSFQTNLTSLAKKNSLYIYQDQYYLVFENINLECSNIKSFYSAITEFAYFVNHSDLFVRKLCEYGKILMKNNAIKICNKHFSE